MQGHSALTLYDELEKITKKFNKDFVADESFYSNIGSILSDGDFSCARILELCKNQMDKMRGGEKYSAQEWLDYIYQYALNYSFPTSVTITFDKKRNVPCEYYLSILQLLNEFEKEYGKQGWLTTYPIYFLTDREVSQLEKPDEYKLFIKAFHEEYVYELMKLNQELSGHNNLDHVCGVHHIAVSVARQLVSAGMPLDLGRVSGAAAGHDIGKYGCRVQELKRLPYLHYYYTEQWFTCHDIPYIGHVALNHSTWDLELENLPVESLILIYSDFRVKNQSGRDYKSSMHIFSLEDSFNIILSKLDNLDEEKEIRYKKVYAKLKDFEDYLLYLGVDISPEAKDGYIPQKQTTKNYSLMQGNEILDHIKYVAINHNIRLMYQLRDQASLNTVLDLARSEIDARNIREYLRVIDEYSTYLSHEQKHITFNFLYDLLIHPEDDIRRHSARIMGKLIAHYDEDYRKEIPYDMPIQETEIDSAEILYKYIGMFINPDHKVIHSHRLLIGVSLHMMIHSLFQYARESKKNEYRDVLLDFYDHENSTEEIDIFLIRTALAIKPAPCDASSKLFEYLFKMIDSPITNLRLSSLRVTLGFLEYLQPEDPYYMRLHYIFSEKITKSDIPAENYLKYKISLKMNLTESIVSEYKKLSFSDYEQATDLFLSNLKTATDWVVKETQVELLLDKAMVSPELDGLYTAMHFCNLLKISSDEAVRNAAGESLLIILPCLSNAQKNDVVVELMRALEIDGYQFAEYIPNYLGMLLLYLSPNELDEVVNDIYIKVRQGNIKTVALLLKTTGVCIAGYSKYKNIFNEPDSAYNKRLHKMLGILLNGLGNYNQQVRQLAFSVIGSEIFASNRLDFVEKNNIFCLICKKILTIITSWNEDTLTLLSNAAAFNYVYRFMVDYAFGYGDMNVSIADKIAFFPGTFDPFSLSHKQIATAIRNLGFEVYLQVDEFSWSKRTLPNYIRRNIISTSISDEMNIFIYPEDFPVNIANNDDLGRLRNNFQGSDVYFASGADVLINATSYMAEKKENSIFTFSHILFNRANNKFLPENERKLNEVISRIDGEVIRMEMSDEYVDISSTQIRDYVDENRDISNMIDQLAQKYIYDNGYYRREPAWKTIIEYESIEIGVEEDWSRELVNEMSSLLPVYHREVSERLTEIAKKPFARVACIRDVSDGNRLICFSVFHWVRSNVVFHELEDSKVSEYVRENAVGRIVMVDGIYVPEGKEKDYYIQILLTESLAYSLSYDYDYAVFHDTLNNYIDPMCRENLKLQGFIELQSSDKDNPAFVVNMNMPCTLNLDALTFIKEPFRSVDSVRSSVIKARKNLQQALVELFPGNLLLSFNVNVLKQALVKKICNENGVSVIPEIPRKLGEAMCVPYGNILHRFIVPNTVTKTLHTEKLFDPDLKNFTIGPFPYYLSLENQIKVIHSFNRPVILVDDLLHKGYRMQSLDPLFKNENILIRKLIVGVLSGQGKELMDIQDRAVDSVYFIPKLKNWFNESLMYPFIGGDTIWRGEYPNHNLLPSINLILPYTSPRFIKGASERSIYNLSMTCFENSRDIMLTLEQEYQRLHGRNLTLARMSEVLMVPRTLDQGVYMQYNLNKGASRYIMNDIEFLTRMERTLVRDVH